MISISLLLLAANPAPFQEPAATAAPQQEPSASARFEALRAEYDEAYQAWMTKVQAMFAEAEASGEPLTEYPPQPGADFVPRFTEAAAEYAGTEGAVPFLVWIVQNGLYQQMPEAKDALSKLMSTHIASEGLAPLGPMLGQLDYVMGEGYAAKMAFKLEKESQSANLRAWAAFTRLSPVFKNNGPKTDAFLGAKKEMLALLEKVDDPYLQMTFDSEVTVLEVFGLGMTAPDITGPDLDGTTFSLTDYKGKVIFLDFWGDW